MRALGQSSPEETQSGSNNQQPNDSDQQIPAAIAKELDAMKKRIAQLEAELRQHQAAEQPMRLLKTGRRKRVVDEISTEMSAAVENGAIRHD
jgi:hypothetical protein